MLLRRTLRPALRSLKRHEMSTFQPQRPILHQRVEEAARRGDMHEVKRLLAEADAATLPRAPPIGRQLLYGGIAYVLWNIAASAYDYRIARLAAVDVLASGSGSAEVALRLRSFQLTGELSSKAEGEGERQARTVRVFPHIYLSDAIFGRSEWVLKCRKLHGHTEWSSGPADMTPPDGGHDTPGSGRWPPRPVDGV
jgi:hypothetical protein